jgi:hypothetical protein
VKAIALLPAILVLCVASPSAHAFEMLELTPTMGLGKPTGEGSSHFNASIGFGVGAAFRPIPQLALGGQLSLDTLSADTGPIAADTSIYMVRALLTPALHFGSGPIDFALGPTFGFFYLHESLSFMGLDATASARGYQLGFATSLLYAVNPIVAFGPYVSWSHLWATRSCETMGSVEVCDGKPDNTGSPGFVSGGVAARF